MKRTYRPAAVIAAIGLAFAAFTASASPAWANAGISVTSDLGTATVDAEYATSITVSGSGFQSLRNGFGGVYVLFGWVDDPTGGTWKPSNGGQVGQNFRYVPDSESKDNAGFQRFVAFPGSDTEASAQAVLADDGSFTVTMTVPGATFESTDRNGDVASVNCLESTCGIITIGAHGVKNATNETFTPLTFTTAGASEETSALPKPSAKPADAKAAPARVGLAANSVVAGTSVVFTAQGFTPGEQVVADFDQGVSAVGPLIAGKTGEVAGALPVPADVRDGTHLVTLRGAGSGTVAETEVTITGGTALTVAATTEPAVATWAWVLLLVGIALAGILLIVSIIVAIVRAASRRKARNRAKQEAAIVTAAPPADTPDVTDATLPLDVPVGAQS